VSAKWLARKDSKVLAIVGAGNMADGAIETCNEVFEWDEVRVWSRSSSTLDGFAERYDGRFAFRLRPSTDLAEVVSGADVVVTLTPARGPIVLDEWISPGTHIAAVGADKGGDQELDPRILQRARIFVDDIRQCRNDGEINLPLAQGLISEKDIAGEIGEVVAGKKPGRTSDSEITVFDSTGIALQDSATVPLEYERALAAGVGIEKKMIST
jgi:alanine dehydrogenase